MQIIVGSQDRYLSTTIGEILASLDAKCIRTGKEDRVVTELKQPNRLVILDVNWKDIQVPGVLKQMVNIGKISGNKIICICPNQEEDQKKLARAARPEKVFIRYDLYTEFKDFLEEILKKKK